MCKSKEDLERAKQLVKEVLARLGLELAEDKTDEIDFHDDDFDFLGFTFKHLQKNKEGNLHYVIKPSNKAVKKFKSDIKRMTPKRCTFSFEKWKERLNPVLRGKYNYFLIANKACKEVKEALKQKGYEFHGYTQQTIESLDSYVRQRLCVNFSCRGKKHGGYNQGRLLNVKYPNKFFGLDIGLVCGEYMTKAIEIPNLKINEFYEKGFYRKRKRTWNWGDKDELFQYMYAK